MLLLFLFHSNSVGKPQIIVGHLSTPTLPFHSVFSNWKLGETEEEGNWRDFCQMLIFSFGYRLAADFESQLLEFQSLFSYHEWIDKRFRFNNIFILKHVESVTFFWPFQNLFLFSAWVLLHTQSKRIMKKLDLAFVVTIQCLESCRKIGFIVIGVREVGQLVFLITCFVWMAGFKTWLEIIRPNINYTGIF